MTTSVRMLLLLGGVCAGSLTVLSGCAEKLADCVEVYPADAPNPGANRLPGYTQTACEQHCKQVTGTIDCYWDG